MSREYREVLSLKVPAGSRTLFIDLKQMSDDSRFLSISEVKCATHDRQERARILIDESYVEALREALDTIVEYLAADSHAGDTRKPEPRAYSVEDIRKSYAHAYEPWSADEECRLKSGFERGTSLQELAKQLGRAPSAIERRLERMRLL